MRLGGAGDVHRQRARARLTELRGHDPGGASPLGHPRQHLDHLRPRERSRRAKGVVGERRQDPLRDEQRGGQPLGLPAEIGPILHLQQVIRVPGSEEALGPLVPAEGAHDVAHERAAAGDADLAGHLASLAVQRGDEPAHPLAGLLFARVRVQRGSRIERRRQHVQRDEERRLAGQAGLFSERDGRARRPDRGPRDLLGCADDTTQVRQLLTVEDVPAVLGVASARRGVKRVDELAPVGGGRAPRLLHRLVGKGVLRGLAAVDLAGGGGTDVVALRREAAHVA